MAGVISDRIGRQLTLLGEFIFQAVVVAVLYKLSGGGGTWPVMLIIVFLLGFNYGANLAVFPAACKDYFGIRNFGLNYGCLFAAFGSAGLIMPWLNGLIRDRTGSSDLSYIIIIALMVVAAVLAVVSRFVGAPRKRSATSVLATQEGRMNGHRHHFQRFLHRRHRRRRAAGKRELGHPCISREVVLDAAEDSGVKERELQSTLEDPPRFWEKTPGRIPAHLNLVRAALLRRAQAGDLVYHGYAGHLLLSGISHVLRVRIIAGTELRIAALMEDYHMSRKEATAHLRKLDIQLIKWTRFLYGVEWQDPSLYDVVLNVDHIDVDGAVDDTRPDDPPRRLPAHRRVAQGLRRPLAQQRRLGGAYQGPEDQGGQHPRGGRCGGGPHHRGRGERARRRTPSRKWPSGWMACGRSIARSASAATGVGEPALGRGSCRPSSAGRAPAVAGIVGMA